MVYIYIVLLSMMFVIIRLVKGPTFADRLVALSAFTTITILLIVIASMQTGMLLYLDIALLLSLLSFVGVLAIAKGGYKK
ncbi:MAG: cation:proton antiporter [Nanoarchaeota archaeon]|nr:cation:proton antiporter [Nanoarchaeota archaeon]MBU1134935.1 cation:proton antiporter [Nanoarchaeota archaeon]MBU2519816.1 cation:proton antiporter [Nanoarchaeota archaeon]